jgi:hypothetical protein
VSSGRVDTVALTALRGTGIGAVPPARVGDVLRCVVCVVFAVWLMLACAQGNSDRELALVHIYLSIDDDDMHACLRLMSLAISMTRTTRCQIVRLHLL